MSALLLALAIVTANQGSVVQLTFPNEPGVKSVEVEWETKKVPAVRLNDKWVTVVGVDLDAKPGDHKANVVFTMQDGCHRCHGCKKSRAHLTPL